MTIDKAILRIEHSSMNVDDKETADFIINIMRKCQKIKEIVKAWNDNNSFDSMCQISEVLEDGKT